ncbi:hypothetical protein [Enterobacter roggenkampii]
MWVSPEIWANLAQPYVVNGVVSGMYCRLFCLSRGERNPYELRADR